MSNKKREVKNLLEESGHINLFTDKNYEIACKLTKEAEKSNPQLRNYFRILGGTREKYIHDLIVKNKAK